MEAFTTLRQAGITLQALPHGRLQAEPRSALTDETRELIRQHKPELLLILELQEVFAEYGRRNGFAAEDIERDFEPMLADPRGWLGYLRRADSALARMVEAGAVETTNARQYGETGKMVTRYRIKTETV